MNALDFFRPIYKLIRYHRLIFDSIADGLFRATYLPWIDSITHVKAREKEEIELCLNSNYDRVWRVLKERLDEPAVRLKIIIPLAITMGEAELGGWAQASRCSNPKKDFGLGRC